MTVLEKKLKTKENLIKKTSTTCTTEKNNKGVLDIETRTCKIKLNNPLGTDIVMKNTKKIKITSKKKLHNQQNDKEIAKSR